MLLSTHSAAELRILDSQPVSAQTKRISAEIFPVHPSCAPTPSSAASSSVSHPAVLASSASVMKTFARRRHFDDFPTRDFSFFSSFLSLSLSLFRISARCSPSISHHIGRNLFFVLSFNGKYLSSSSSGLRATTTTTISEPFVLNCFYLAIQ